MLLLGATGFLGSWVARVLETDIAKGAQVGTPTRARCDLRNFNACQRVVAEAAHEARARGRGLVVVQCAGLSGGLGMCRERPLDLLHEHLGMGSNVLMACERARLIVGDRLRVVLVGHMTSYPTDAPQPLREDSMLGNGGVGQLDPSTQHLGRAKAEVLALARQLGEREGLDWTMVVPTNLYGEGDAMDDPARSHAAGAMMHRFASAVKSNAPRVVHWGTGRAIRDFLHVEDAARGVVRAARVAGARGMAINLGGGREVSLRELSDVMAKASGFGGEVVWDASKPDGVARRVLAIDRARDVLGWEPQVSLEQGVARTIRAVRAGLG